MEILRVENLTKVYGKGENEVRAILTSAVGLYALCLRRPRKN